VGTGYNGVIKQENTMGIIFIVCEWDDEDGTSVELEFPTFTTAHKHLIDSGWVQEETEFNWNTFGAYYTHTEEGSLPCAGDYHADITMTIR
jgi:hypothetical protein